MRSDGFKERLFGWLTRPAESRLQVSLVAAASGMFCVVVLLVTEALLLFGAVNPARLWLPWLPVEFAKEGRPGTGSSK